jgi:hypothetical protein
MGTAEEGFRGLGGIFNEDDNNDCKILQKANAAPSLKELHRRGVWLGAHGEPQAQVQDMQTGFDPSAFYVGCEPFVSAPGTTIPIKSDVRTPNNTAHAYLAADFVLPNVGDTIQITVQLACGESADDFASSVGEYDGRQADLGVFVGGVFFDLVSIEDSTHMTIRNRGLPGAGITSIG